MDSTLLTNPNGSDFNTAMMWHNRSTFSDDATYWAFYFSMELG
jgi:hypothetical protein